MIKPNLHPEESQRLCNLTGLDILDTPPEERFDSLTRMAKNTFKVPIALVSLVDKDRQWFKSCVGLPVRETARDISFCGHAILGDDLFIIPDASKDVRFEDNPLVLDEPNIRFYAGVPLKSISGDPLGTFCIIDSKPRTLNSLQIRSLKDLAFLAEREIAIDQISTFDTLTNIPNRRGFTVLANQGLSLSNRYDRNALLLHFNINNFKKINDNYGNFSGDQILVAFANALKESTSDSDICARLNGDEFAVLLFDTSTDQVDSITHLITQSFTSKIESIDSRIHTTFSSGAIEYSHSKHITIDSLLKDADILMQQKKNNKLTQMKDRLSYIAGKITSGSN